MASPTKLVIILLAFSLVLNQQLPFTAAQTTAVNGGYWLRQSGFPASDINSNLFTHLHCVFAAIRNQTHQVYVLPSDIDSFSQFTEIVQLKNPSVKTLMTIGGGSWNKADFSAMAAQSASRKAFIDSSIKLARDYGFSGLDLNWRDPETSSDMMNLGALLTEWRKAITAEANNSGKAALLLTAALHYSPVVNGLSHPATTINSALDWVNLLAHSIYVPSDHTNSHAMLNNPKNPSLSGSFGIEKWIQAGVSAKKLVLSIPFYGYVWRLADAQNHGLLAPSTGLAGPVESGVMRYSAIRRNISQSKAAVVYNSTIVGNYCYSGTTWIGYDDVQAIDAKVSYAKETGLLGYTAWHVAGDYNWVLSRQAKSSWEFKKEGQLCINEDFVSSMQNIVCYDDACIVSVM